MTPEQIILDGDKLLEQMAGVDERLLNKVIEFISLNTKEGKVQISDEDLANLEDILYAEVKDSAYEEKLVNYLGLFDAMFNAISHEQARVNNLKINAINELWSNAENNQDIINKVKYDLGQQGVKNVIIKGIADAVRETNYFNLDYKSAVTKLRELIKPTTGEQQTYTQRYLEQTAKDALNQYDGAVQDKVRTTYGFKNVMYVGNSIETSRPFCVHLRDELGGKISRDDLEKALKEYCPNGQPSDQYVTFEVPHKGKVKKKRGSGMIEGTTLDNFAQMRGGYGCRHRAIWVK